MDTLPAGDLPFWSLHTHSKYSVKDALPEVGAIVKEAVRLGYPALGLTDHGTPSGLVQHYLACRKAGIEPLPGLELYVSPDVELKERKTYHLTMAAYTEQGYRNLMHVATHTSRQFWYKPQIDMADFAAMAENGATKGLVVSTGCLGGVIPQVLLSRGHHAAVKLARTLAGWFPRVYIELQNHGIEIKEFPGVTDDEVVDGLWDVAQEVGLPVILARDSHYVGEKDRELHEALKQLMTWSDDPDDGIFSGQGYHMVDAGELRRFFRPKHLRAGLEGLADLAEAAYVRLPELENFHLKVPDVSVTGDPQPELEDLVFRLMPEQMRHSKPHMDQLRKELDVIRAGGMAPYMLLCHIVAEFMRDNGIRYWVRGSAAACLVLYILQVTQFDPLPLGLRFDRFLSSNRMKPPDVDFDVEHTRRAEVVDMLNRRWSAQAIGSLGKFSMWAEEEGEGDHAGGSLRVQFYATLRKRGITKPPQWRDVPIKDRKMLLALSDLKLISGYGRHAAGYIVAPDRQSLEQLPLAYISSSKSFVTAYGKKDVEKLGFLKLDLLGQRTATAVRIMEETSGVKFEDVVHTHDAMTFKQLASGRTDGVFQLSGFTMTKGMRELRPKKITDIIAAQALYRPATINSGAKADYLARKRGLEPIPERHQIIMDATKETFGVLLYQEQVMDVLQALGLTPTELEEMLDAVKASNEYSIGAAEAIEDMMPRIRELAGERGWTAIDIDWLVDSLGAYADYSFNRAHAAAYGYVAYFTAWMKTHRPLDFWHAMMVAYADHEKAPEYMMSARRDGIRFFPVHVNESVATYSLVREHNAIRKGLLAVKGVGPVAAREITSKMPFSSLTDFGRRVLPARVSGSKDLALHKHPADCGGMVLALYDADAFTGLEHEAIDKEEKSDDKPRGRRNRVAGPNTDAEGHPQPDSPDQA